MSRRIVIRPPSEETYTRDRSDGFDRYVDSGLEIHIVGERIHIIEEVAPARYTQVLWLARKDAVKMATAIVEALPLDALSDL
jgi:hypothetical protein